MSLTSEIIVLVLSFASVIVAVRGKTWDDDKKGWRKISPTGWIATTIGLLACLIGIQRARWAAIEKHEDEKKISRYYQVINETSNKYSNLRYGVIKAFDDLETSVPIAAEQGFGYFLDHINTTEEVDVAGFQGIKVDVRPTLEKVWRPAVKKSEEKVVLEIDRVKSNLDKETKIAFGEP